MSREVKSRGSEEYYMMLLAAYGQDEKGYNKLVWQDETTLPSAFIDYIYSDDFLEMLNGDITKWYEGIIDNIKSSIAYSLFKERTENFFIKEWIFDNLIEINNYIVEVYEYQKKQSINLQQLKQTAMLLRDGNIKADIRQNMKSSDKQPKCLSEAHYMMEELNASYRSLQKQYRENNEMKRKLGYLMKKPLYRIGIIEEKDKAAVLQQQLQVLEQKINKVEAITEALQQRYDVVEGAINKLQKEILTPQIIGELTNIQQQLPLTNDAILKQIVKPLLRKINQKFDMEIPKGSYCFKLYIEACILCAFKGPVAKK